MIELKKGEGAIKVKKVKDGIQISYRCIDDASYKALTTDDIMKILGYEIKDPHISKNNNKEEKQ